MRWPVRPRRLWKTWFAWYPMQIDGQWIWLERYEWRDCSLYIEVRLPDTAA